MFKQGCLNNDGMLVACFTELGRRKTCPYEIGQTHRSAPTKWCKHRYHRESAQAMLDHAFMRTIQIQSIRL